MAGGSSLPPINAAVQTQAETLQAVVDHYLAGRASIPEALERLRQVGAPAAVVDSYLAQIDEHTARNAPRVPQRHPLPDPPVAGPSRIARDEQAVEPPPVMAAPNPRQPAHVDAPNAPAPLVDPPLRSAIVPDAPAPEEDVARLADEVRWARVAGRLQGLERARAGPLENFNAEEFLSSLQGALPSAGIPANVLAVAPHLAQLERADGRDPVVQKTIDIRTSLGSEKASEAVLAAVSHLDIDDPLPRPIWKAIIQDHAVDFEKLLASLGNDFDLYDDPKAFVGNDFAIVRKDQILRTPVLTETDWLRCFRAWSRAVLLIYPHRTDELAAYGRIVDEMFRTCTSPTVAIHFDKLVRQAYGKRPFRMDNRDRLHIFSNVALHSGLVAKPRSAPSSAIPRRSQVCLNWNNGRCSDPCPNLRRHGECSVCHGAHRAREEESCKATFATRARKGNFGRNRSGAESKQGA